MYIIHIKEFHKPNKIDWIEERVDKMFVDLEVFSFNHFVLDDNEKFYFIKGRWEEIQGCFNNSDTVALFLGSRTKILVKKLLKLSEK